MENNSDTSGVVAFFAGIRFLVNFSDDDLRKNGARVTGTTSETGRTNVLVTFNYSGRDYTVKVGQRKLALQGGEHYTTFIDKNDPGDCLVEFSDPVFDRSLFTVVKVAALKKVFLSDKMEFEYIVRNKHYTRLQVLPPNIDFDKFKAKATLYVNNHDPRTAYVVFN